METTTVASRRSDWAVVGVRRAFFEQVRATGLDDLGQPAVRFRSSQGGEPLRDQLRRAGVGEAVLLGSHALFDEAGPFREFGPIYVSAELPAANRTPEALLASDYFRHELILRKYDRRRWITAARRISKHDAPILIEEWLRETDVLFVDARFSEYGCFACRFVRAKDEQPACAKHGR